jgi:hypothetical protein
MIFIDRIKSHYMYPKSSIDDSDMKSLCPIHEEYR